MKKSKGIIITAIFAVLAVGCLFAIYITIPMLRFAVLFMFAVPGFGLLVMQYYIFVMARAPEAKTDRVRKKACSEHKEPFDWQKEEQEEHITEVYAAAPAVYFPVLPGAVKGGSR